MFRSSRECPSAWRSAVHFPRRAALIGDHTAMRRLLSFLFKAAISALLLYVSLRRVDLGGVAQRLGALDLRWIAFVVVTLCVQIALNALRWREIVAVCGASSDGTDGLAVTPSSASSSARCCPRRSAATPPASGCWRAAAPAGRPRSIRCSLTASSVSRCWRRWCRLPALDAAAGAGPYRAQALVAIGIGALFAAAVFLGLGIPQSVADGTMVDHPPSRHRIAAGLEALPLRGRPARRAESPLRCISSRCWRPGARRAPSMPRSIWCRLCLWSCRSFCCRPFRSRSPDGACARARWSWLSPTRGWLKATA